MMGKHIQVLENREWRRYTLYFYEDEYLRWLHRSEMVAEGVTEVMNHINLGLLETMDYVIGYSMDAKVET